MDSRFKFTKIDYARLMQGNYGIGEYISKYVKHIILTLEVVAKEIVETDKNGNSDWLNIMEPLSVWRMEMRWFCPKIWSRNSPQYLYKLQRSKDSLRWKWCDKNEFKNTRSIITYQTQSNIAKRPNIQIGPLSWFLWRKALRFQKRRIT